jgi:peptidoglycan/LPS O-acetylase OafA/YrhL
MHRTTAELGRPEGLSASFWERYNAIPLPIPPSTTPAPDATKTASHGTRLPYIPALDGIRALAVGAVLLYHQNVAWLPGGFLGVEVFFVLSGYLITSLLLAEARSTGKVDLKSFWMRRARRLLPALYLLLTVFLTYALVFLPSEVTRLRGDAVAALFYVTNWWSIFDHKSYFEIVGRPSLFQHLWSLAVEEQFYVLWPPIFAFAITRWRERRIVLLTLGVAAISTILMALLFQPGIDPSRVYYGTDTRAAELLIGAALAFVWEPGLPRKWGGRIAGQLHEWLASSRWANTVLEMAGMAALGAIFVAFLRVSEFSPFLYRGGFLLVALATAGLIASVVHQRTRFVSRALGVAPLRWIGLRSYGIYLWHWPVYMVTRPELDIQLNGVPLLALRVVVTLALVEISYRWVETPCRKGALGRAWRTLRDRSGGERRTAQAGLAGAAGMTATFAVVLSVMVAYAKPAGPPSYLAVQAVHITAPRTSPVATPQQVVVQNTPTPEPPTPTPTPQSTPTPEIAITAPTPTPTPTPQTAITPVVIVTPTVSPFSLLSLPPTPTPTPAPSPTPTPTPMPTPVPTAQVVLDTPVTAVGDSVMVGASDDLARNLPNLDLDAQVGLQVPQAIKILQERRDAQQLNQVVVLDIGNNGWLTSDQFDQVMQVLKGVRRVYFVNLREPRDWEGPNNQVLADGVQRYANATLIDWHAATEGRSDLFWDDGIHLRPEGAAFYASLIVQQLAKNN